jgi:hypothetical protein
MTRVVTRKEFFPFSTAAAFQFAFMAVQRLNWSMTFSNLATGEIWAEAPASWRSWGESIRLKVTPESNGSSIVMKSASKLPTALVDLGKNTDNQKDFFGAIASEVLKQHISFPQPSQ